MQIQAVTGSETFRSGAATFRAHACNSRLFPLVVADWPKTFLGKANQGVVQIGRLTKLHASTTPLDALGTFWAGTYEVADGMVLVVEATKSLPMSQRGSSLARKAFVGLRVRDNAPLIKVQLQRVADNVTAQFDVYVQGRMDVLTYNDMLRLGADPARGRMQDIPLYVPSRRASLIDIHQLAPEIAPIAIERVERVQVGEEQVAVRSSRRRRIVDLGD